MCDPEGCLQAVRGETPNRETIMANSMTKARTDATNTAVSIREAQAAAMFLGDAATSAIVGPGGLSGASAEQLRRLVRVAKAGGLK